MPVEITGRDLTLEGVVRIARGREAAVLSAGARERVEKSHAFLRTLIADGMPIYGLTTGFGALAGAAVGAADNRRAAEHPEEPRRGRRRPM